MAKTTMEAGIDCKKSVRLRSSSKAYTRPTGYFDGYNEERANGIEGSCIKAFISGVGRNTVKRTAYLLPHSQSQDLPRRLE